VGDSCQKPLKIYKSHCPWLFQLADQHAPREERDYGSMRAFSSAVRRSDANRLVARPLDCLAVLSAAPYGVRQWFEVAVARDFEAAIEVAELARRHRFCIAVRRALLAYAGCSKRRRRATTESLAAAGPAVALSGYVDLSSRAAMRDELAIAAHARKDNSEQFRKQGELFEELTRVAVAQRVIRARLRSPQAGQFRVPAGKTRTQGTPDGTVCCTSSAPTVPFTHRCWPEPLCQLEGRAGPKCSKKIAALLRVGN
jgi:hypothetical protein